MKFNRKLLAELSRLAVYSLFISAIILLEVLHRDFVSFEQNFKIGLILLLGLTPQVFLLFKPSPSVEKIVPFFDQLVLTCVASVVLSSGSIFLVVSALNIFLCAIQFGGSTAIKLGLVAVGLFNFGYINLEAQGMIVTDISKLVFGAGILSSAFISGGLGQELQTLEAELDAKARDLSALQDLSDLLIENIGAGVIAVSHTGRIVRSNRGAAKIFQTLGLMGLNLQDISEAIWRSVQNSTQTETYEVEQLNIQGQTMVLEVIVSPLKVTAATEPGWVVLIQNRTEIKNLESQLRQKEKLAAVGQLAAGIAHEIRNPLASISGSVQLLAGTLETPTPEDKKLLAIVIKEIDRLNDLITEFLDYVRPDSDKRDNFDLAKLVSDILEMIKGDVKLPKGLQVKADLPSNCKIWGHQDKIKQALMNMVVNAYQAMEKSTEKILSVKLSVVNDWAVLRIQDSGCGIPRDHIRRIFEPFHTTKPKGTGLGLAISHKVVESHGGQIEVRSEVNGGTEFIIKFPVHSV